MVKHVLIAFFGTLGAILLVALLAMFALTGGHPGKLTGGANDEPTETAKVVQESEAVTLEPVVETVPAEPDPPAAEAAEPEEAQEEEAEPEPEEEPARVDPYADVQEDAFTARVATAESDVVTLGFTGDVLFDGSYAIQAQINRNGGDIRESVGESLLEEMNRVDFLVVNNEFPYTDRGAPQADKTFTFHAQPDTVKQMKILGADLVSLANNHSFDYGETGFLDSMDILDRAGVARVGAGHDIDEASHPYYIVAEGMKIAIIAATQIERYGNPNTRGATESQCGVFRCLDDTLLCKRVQEAQEECDFVIVFIHWGTENEIGPDSWQQKQGPEIAAAGADLIIGGHSHCLQPVTFIDDIPVMYSLGNFLFNSKTLDTCLVECDIERTDGPAGQAAHLKALRFLPCIQSGMRVRFAEGEENNRILQYMRDISPGVEIDEEGSIALRK